MAILFDPELIPELREEILSHCELLTLRNLALVNKGWEGKTARQREALIKTFGASVEAYFCRPSGAQARCLLWLRGRKGISVIAYRPFAGFTTTMAMMLLSPEASFVKRTLVMFSSHYKARGFHQYLFESLPRARLYHKDREKLVYLRDVNDRTSTYQIDVISYSKESVTNIRGLGYFYNRIVIDDDSQSMSDVKLSQLLGLSRSLMVIVGYRLDQNGEEQVHAAFPDNSVRIYSF